MRYTSNKAVAVLAIAMTLMLAGSFMSTQFQISDTDPSTYVIVPLLMLPVFAIFMLRDGIEPRVGPKDIVIGIATFAVFIALTVYLRYSLSFLFSSYRVDLLLFPIAIAALVTMLFGSINIRRFSGLMVYALLMSPIVLMPVLKAFNGFNAANTRIVYNMMRLFVGGVSYVAPITIKTALYSIQIGQACVSIGIFIAMALFLVPIAHFYTGKRTRKALWVVSGVMLLLILNIFRMLTISAYWLSNGPNAAVALIHMFIGGLLFYAAIVVMLLVAGRFGLGLTRLKLDVNAAQAAQGAKGPSMAPAAIALALAAFYILATIGLGNAVSISPIAMNNRVAFNFSDPSISANVLGALKAEGYNSLYFTINSGTEAAITVWNSTINTSRPIMLYYAPANLTDLRVIITNSTVQNSYFIYGRDGVSNYVFDILYNGTRYMIYYTVAPFALANGTSMISSVYEIIPDYVISGQTCDSYDKVYTSLYNTFGTYPTNAAEIANEVSAYCIGRRMA